MKRFFGKLEQTYDLKLPSFMQSKAKKKTDLTLSHAFLEIILSLLEKAYEEFLLASQKNKNNSRTNLSDALLKKIDKLIAEHEHHFKQSKRTIQESFSSHKDSAKTREQNRNRIIQELKKLYNLFYQDLSDQINLQNHFKPIFDALASLEKNKISPQAYFDTEFSNPRFSIETGKIIGIEFELPQITIRTIIEILTKSITIFNTQAVDSEIKLKMEKAANELISSQKQEERKNKINILKQKINAIDPDEISKNMSTTGFETNEKFITHFNCVIQFLNDYVEDKAYFPNIMMIKELWREAKNAEDTVNNNHPDVRLKHSEESPESAQMEYESLRESYPILDLGENHIKILKTIVKLGLKTNNQEATPADHTSLTLS